MRGQIATCHALAKAEAVELGTVGIQGDNQVTHALAIGQLGKHHNKQMMPACK